MAVQAEYLKENWDTMRCRGQHLGVAMPVTTDERFYCNAYARGVERCVKALCGAHYDHYLSARKMLRAQTLEQLEMELSRVESTKQNKERVELFDNYGNMEVANAEHRREMAVEQAKKHSSEYFRETLLAVSGVRKQEDGSWRKND